MYPCLEFLEPALLTALRLFLSEGHLASLRSSCSHPAVAGAFSWGRSIAPTMCVFGEHAVSIKSESKTQFLNRKKKSSTTSLEGTREEGGRHWNIQSSRNAENTKVTRNSVTRGSTASLVFWQISFQLICFSPLPSGHSFLHS